MRKILSMVFAISFNQMLPAQDSSLFNLTFNHLALSVKDADRSAAFYKTVLNLKEITNRTKMEGIRWFSLGEGKELHIISILKGDVTINKAVHFALTTSDFDSFIKTLDRMNIIYSDWPGATQKINIRADGIQQVYFQDPDGYWIEVNSVAHVKTGSDPNTISYGNNKEAGNFITVNGVKIYYEIYGEGDPLVLIHGNGGNIAYMQPQIEYFARKYKVITMDCRGRGKSDLGKDSLTYIQMTKDINAILNHLQLDSAYVIGRSDGGIIALLLAEYYPGKVKKVAAFAANLTPDTTALDPFFYHQVQADRKQADAMIEKKDTTQNWRVSQQRNRLMEFQPQISAEDLHKIKCPVLVLSSDRDIIREEHTLFIYRNIPKANLCIFTGENHYVTKNNPDLFNTTIDRYFNEPFTGDNLKQ